MEISPQTPKDDLQLTHSFHELRDRSLSVLQGEETFWALVEFIPNAVVAHNRDRIIYVNPAASKLFGAESETEMLGLDLLELTHPDEREEIFERRAKAIGKAVFNNEEALFVCFVIGVVANT